jgi:SH3-like domain-containing protein
MPRYIFQPDHCVTFRRKSTKYQYVKTFFWRHLLVLGFFFFISAAGFLQAEMLSIAGDKVNLRSGPGKKYSVKWEYGSGFPIEVIERKNNWVKISDFEKDTGWVHKSLLTSEPHMIVKANKNTDNRVNIRNGPGSEYKIVGKAYYGVVFKTIEHQVKWIKVRHESGLSGWISSGFLWGY